MARGRHGIVSAEAAEDFRAVLSRLEAAPADMQQLLASTAADQLSAAWGEELEKQPATPQQRKFVLTDSAAEPNVAGLRVRTGWVDEWAAFEFGTNDRERFGQYKRRNKSGSRTTVIRRTRRQLPPRKPGGYIAYPAANKLGVRVFNMWAELLRKVTGDAFDGGKR